jgi:hypothetical protein
MLPLFAACGGSSPSSPSVSSPVTPTAPVPSTVSVDASLTETGSGAAVGSFQVTVSRLPALVEVTQPGFVPRSAWITSARPTIDLIRDAAPFSLAFYRQFARGSNDRESLQSLRRWNAPPRIYITTVDEAGTPVPAAQLDSTESVLTSSASEFTGGRFGLGGVERGTGTREGQPGWITIKWSVDTSEAQCAESFVGQEGSAVVFNYLRRGNCACGTLGTRPRTVKHELGHIFGYWHTDSPSDLMSGSAVTGCDGSLSARERYHAAIVYARPRGNRDVDVDPTTVTTQMAPARVID